MLHSLLRILVSLAALALAGLPAIVVFKAGWLTAGPADSSTLERVALFVVVLMVWMLAVFVLLIWCNDRLGVNWHAWDRAPRQEKRRRRRAAGLRFLEGQEAARRGDRDPRERGSS